MRNLYKVLGIASTADDLRIKAAFRRRALRTHPDLNPGNDEAERRFRELAQAYAVLRDAKARAAYDAHLARHRSRMRRRFVQSAAVMVGTFVLTTGSAVFVLGQQGLNVHSETWQIATAWLTSVEVEPASPPVPAVTEAVKKAAPGVAPATGAAPPSKAPSTARSKLESHGKAQSKSASPKVAAAASDPAQKDAWWPW